VENDILRSPIQKSYQERNEMGLKRDGKNMGTKCSEPTRKRGKRKVLYPTGRERGYQKSENRGKVLGKGAAEELRTRTRTKVTNETEGGIEIRLRGKLMQNEIASRAHKDNEFVPKAHRLAEGELKNTYLKKNRAGLLSRAK